MKAVVRSKYGPPDVLRLAEIDKPVPKENEILVRVRATTVTAGDAIMRSGAFPPLFWLPGRMMFGLTKPKNPVLGVEFSGEIEAVGAAVTSFKAGDAVFGAMGGMRTGAHAEYLSLAADGPVVPKPENLSFEEAAAVPVGAGTALHFLRAARIAAGHTVLIYGASGGVGTWAVQLAKHFGARVTAVCSGANAEMVKSLGADAVIDYTKEDFTRGGERYDIIFDTVGKSPFSRSMAALNRGGALALTRFGGKHLVGKLWYQLMGKRVVVGTAEDNAADLTFLKELLEAGTIHPTIDRRFPLERFAEAHALVDSGRKRGSAVITLE